MSTVNLAGFRYYLITLLKLFCIKLGIYLSEYLFTLLLKAWRMYLNLIMNNPLSITEAIGLVVAISTVL